MSAVPAKWPLTRLGDICEFKYGKSLPETARAGGDISVFGSNGVVGAHNSALTEGPTIVIGRKGSHGEVNFSPASCWPIDTTYYVDRSATKADIRWLFHRLCGAGLNQMNRAAAVPGLNREDAYRVEILLPPLEEQRRIAAILDQTETLRTQRRTALALLDSLTQSLFLDMFGDPLDNTKRWEWRCMSELFETSPIFGTMIPGEAERGSWLCLRVANIQDWQLTLEDKKYVDLPTSAVERHSVKAGDLLMARAIASQEHLGKCVVAQPGDELWAFDSHLMRLRFRADRAVPEFIRQLLRTPGGRNIFLKASRKSSVQYNINTKEISALEVPVPPLPLQQTFATRIASIEALKATPRRARAALDALFASLQQRAFAGQL